MWIDIIGDGVNDLRPWKMGTNWLSGNNKNHELVDELQNDYFIEGEPYEHQYRTTYVRNQTAENDFSVRPKEKSIPPTIQPPLYFQSKTIDDDTDTKVEIESENKITNDKPILLDTNNNDLGKEHNKKDINLDFAKPETASKIIETNPKINGPPENMLNILDTPITPLTPSQETRTDTKQETNEKNKEKYPKRDEVPLGPPKRPLDPTPFLGGKLIENRLVKASLLLLDELDRDELEIIARVLHDKLQLACIPLIVNPIG